LGAVSGGCRDHDGPKEPKCNKNNNCNFGPHRSIVLSFGLLWLTTENIN
jgi:hypothetical protein